VITFFRGRRGRVENPHQRNNKTNVLQKRIYLTAERFFFHFADWGGYILTEVDREEVHVA
jgi:hypothetical protein